MNANEEVAQALVIAGGILAEKEAFPAPSIQISALKILRSEKMS